MKRIVLALCVIVALATAADGEMFKCINDRGSEMITNYPIPGTKCKSLGGYNAAGESTAPRRGQKTEEAIRDIDRQIEQIQARRAETHTVQELRWNPTTKKAEVVNVQKTINSGRDSELLTRLLDMKQELILEAERREAETRNPQDVGLKMRNQQDAMKNKMDRQQREIKAQMEKQKRETEAQRALMEAQRMKQQSEINKIQLDQSLRTIYGK